MTIEFKNIQKSFGPLKAVDNVNLSIKSGEIHSIVGENGAGKSTLMKILYGIHKPTSGKIFLNGVQTNVSNPKKAISLGIGMVHQEFMLVDEFTVYENVVLGFEPSSNGVFLRKNSKQIVQQLCNKFKIDLNVEERVSNLSVGQKQKVEILKLLHRKANILILDEPTAVLTPTEVNTLFNTIRQFKKSGKTVIFISHKLKEVLEISDRITVMRSGKTLATYENKNLDIDKLSELIAGRKIKKLKFVNSSSSEHKILQVINLYAINEKGERKLNGLSFDVRKGEVYGMVGVSGNGQSELEEIISGIFKKYSGEVFLSSTNIKPLTVDEIRNLGLAYIPEDRLKTGLSPIATINENIIMGYQNDKHFVNAFGYLNKRKITDFALSMINKYNISAISAREQVGNLSGGNMQKVVIAREFEHNPKFILISHPTRGVDIGGIEFIHEKILQMKEKGKSALLISADIDEILDLADRIGVIYNGKIVYESLRKNVDIKKVGKAMLTGYDE